MFNFRKSVVILSLFFFSILFSVPRLALALVFPLPHNGDNIVGVPQTAEVQDGEDFSDVALRYDIGFYELYEANPGVDPDNPPSSAELIIPTQYILPAELKENMILINLAEMRLYYEPKGGRSVYIFPIGIGKSDWETPTGLMHVAIKVSHPSWIVPDSIFKYRAAHGDPVAKVVPPGPENPLGSYKFILSVPGYDIHGTNLPAGVGRRSSAGCIRLYDEDVTKLFPMVKVGTPVLIINRPFKPGFLNGKLYLESHVPLLEQRLETRAGDMTPVISILETANKYKGVEIDWKRAFKIANDHVGVPRPVEKTVQVLP